MLMTTKFRADMKRIIEKMEALADGTGGAVDYALARRLRELARRRRVALDWRGSGKRLTFRVTKGGWLFGPREGGDKE